MSQKSTIISLMGKIAIIVAMVSASAVAENLTSGVPGKTIGSSAQFQENTEQESRWTADHFGMRLIDRCEAEYAKRYAELKDAHDRFLDYLTTILTVVSVVVGIIGIMVPIYGAYKTKSSIKETEKERDKIQQQVDEMAQRAEELEKRVCSSRGEQYFQLARHGFEQYKMQASIDVLETVVRDLAHSIAKNVEAKDAFGLKSSISFLNVVLNKPAMADPSMNFPKELEDDRRIVEQRLKKFVWGFKLSDAQRVLEQGDIDELHVSYSLSNLEKIMTRFGV